MLPAAGVSSSDPQHQHPRIMSEPIAALAPFLCPYCGQQQTLEVRLAGCVAPCPSCRRDITVPEPDEWGDLPIPPPRRRIWTPLAVLLGMIFGALVGGLLLMIPMWFYALSVIGLGVRHISIAAMIGAALGVLLGGRLGYRLVQD